jgi:hypothetical protein
MQLEIDEDRKRRDWNATGYDAMPPRTTDIRKEAIREGEKKSRRRSQRKR